MALYGFKESEIACIGDQLMTDILGANNMGFNTEEDGKLNVKIEKALKETFRPEFLNRIDDIIVFHKLGRDDTAKIADIMLANLKKRLAVMEVGMELTHEAVIADVQRVKGLQRVAVNAHAQRRIVIKVVCNRRAPIGKKAFSSQKNMDVIVPIHITNIEEFAIYFKEFAMPLRVYRVNFASVGLNEILTSIIYDLRQCPFNCRMSFHHLCP